MRNLQVATRSTSPITSFVITGLTNDIDYILILQAKNQYGNSSRALSGRRRRQTTQTPHTLGCETAPAKAAAWRSSMGLRSWGSGAL